MKHPTNCGCIECWDPADFIVKPKLPPNFNKLARWKQAEIRAEYEERLALLDEYRRAMEEREPGQVAFAPWTPRCIQLLKVHRRWALAIARHYSRGKNDPVDCGEAALTGLWDAVRRYRFDGTPFRAYARPRVVGAIMNAIRPEAEWAKARVPDGAMLDQAVLAEEYKYVSQPRSRTCKGIACPHNPPCSYSERLDGRPDRYPVAEVRLLERHPTWGERCPSCGANCDNGEEAHRGSARTPRLRVIFDHLSGDVSVRGVAPTVEDEENPVTSRLSGKEGAPTTAADDSDEGVGARLGDVELATLVRAVEATQRYLHRQAWRWLTPRPRTLH